MRCPSVTGSIFLSLFMLGLASAANISTSQTRGSKLRISNGAFSPTCSFYKWDGKACMLGAICEGHTGSKVPTNINLNQGCFSAFVPEGTKPEDEENNKVLEWTFMDGKTKGLRKATSQPENVCQAPHSCYMSKGELDGGMTLICPGDQAFLLDQGIINDNGQLKCKKSGMKRL
ncbi:hypothetical protein QBC45DRAFT_425128 [Copromyces sp. CBS 386.78]|nr:hypothetical protein QBC45DRAFT_425128 [Copromyces sp. CBS 386.78]